MLKCAFTPGTSLGRRGQTILEYTIIVIVILGVMISMKDYVKRGIQGRWKSATDDFGDQYDPQSVNSSTNYATQVNSTSIVNVTGGTVTGNSDILPQQVQWTGRTDQSNEVETKTGFTQVGS